MVDPRQQLHCLIVLERDGVKALTSRGSQENTLSKAEKPTRRDALEETLGLQDCYRFIEPTMFHLTQHPRTITGQRCLLLSETSIRLHSIW